MYIANTAGFLSNFFHSDCNFTNGTYKGVGVGSRGGLRLPLKIQTAVLCGSDTNSQNPQDKPRQSLAAVWHHTHPY